MRNSLLPPKDESCRSLWMIGTVYIFSIFRRKRIRHASYHPNTQFLWPVANLEANEPLLNVSIGRLMALLGTRQLVTTGGEDKLNKIYLVDKDGVDLSSKEKYQ